MNNYYVYHYLREDGTPYYVGKGKADRAYKPHNVPVPPADRIIFVARDLTESQALQLEIENIAFYGRKDNNTGILRNLTNGGEGASGFVHNEQTKNTMRLIKTGKSRKPFSESHIANMKKAQSNRSDETKARMSEARKGKSKTQEHRNKISIANKQRIVTRETKDKIRKANTGKILSEDTKEKLRIAANKRWAERKEQCT